MSFKTGQWIVLKDPDNFSKAHGQNEEIARAINGEAIKITVMDRDGDVRRFVNADGNQFDMGLYRAELERFFEPFDKTEVFGKFKLIITYIENGKTLEEEGVTNIELTHDTVSYKYNRKKMGFLTYKGEVSLKIDELKQITVSTPASERVFHIENGVVIREHIMYDNNRKFKKFSLRSKGDN
ncbi:hypothetical protein pEaSNUABM50_00526 [Erwinia phage pEa_SNUABM_50]|uniref:Uncharacterized protein n=4 Tax=Eneladusvirus BF TaxID=2560751 RepID=A0A7L8ZNB1_9CAUD|nr:hypothetical protein FDH34_gp418 [Serratia phage BF]QOI71447.1 hypothetical protein pEaSNUABM12_00530 [Erwinia phage pEa_SNUABM_12]QOI71976.1 hypothetical protein pEaSNUABM47_00527 [Erwinia phage pEa_SNUABM_47]QOI72516.1 hypothetical protein pEaSNUABM50_00526 [Erwinia phage pEa_SNUABM_50]QXO11647.1 hypothetical protein pEaSNUABM19_00536 [Erwinia phage pEa_SNUABM_19]QXO12195.1 hypothetical protein pEaSNUABM44_00534 [Erwinia phage pEa_SNUABM_44]QXO12751.1 hypothetical protein pEaSNUABM49_005